ncbi:MAG: hypothetical protein V7L21_12390 [Nostoc sp.]|uniref:hypothetical protein n=1 Tax=unclassified Nostoc TaxID=2593658 RepID=UPI0025D9DCCB|nr:hypothetical protein [Nostoc sp. NMS9]MBN3943582.1 hypothetical protein [Nostoc sp. NMS9]
MKVNQQEQLLTELDSVLEEISDDNSASLTGGARSTFSGTIPAFGSRTFSKIYTTTSQFNDISIRLNQNINEFIKVKAVRADNLRDISSFVRSIPPNSAGKLITVAANVRDGVAFRLNFSIDGFNIAKNVSGPITY